MIRQFLNRLLVQRNAQARLAAMIEARRSSPEIVQFRQRRAAALKGAGRVTPPA